MRVGLIRHRLKMKFKTSCSCLNLLCIVSKNWPRYRLQLCTIASSGAFFS